MMRPSFLDGLSGTEFGSTAWKEDGDCDGGCVARKVVRITVIGTHVLLL